MRAGAKKQHEFAAFKLARGPLTTAPFGHGAHGGAAGASTNHHDVGARVVGHQKAVAKRADNLHFVTHLEVAQIVGAHATHRLALVVFQHAFDRERQIVIARALAIAWAGD